jgi:hypothetical protein
MKRIFIEDSAGVLIRSFAHFSTDGRNERITAQMVEEYRKCSTDPDKAERLTRIEEAGGARDILNAATFTPTVKHWMLELHCWGEKARAQIRVYSHDYDGTPIYNENPCIFDINGLPQFGGLCRKDYLKATAQEIATTLDRLANIKAGVVTDFSVLMRNYRDNSRAPDKDNVASYLASRRGAIGILTDITAHAEVYRIWGDVIRLWSASVESKTTNN